MPVSETDRKSSTIYTENTVTFRILSKLDLNDRGDCVEVEFNLKPLGKNLHFTLRSDLLLSLSLLWNDPHARVIPSSAFYNLSDLLITISLYFLMSFVHVGLDHITIHIFTILMSLLQSQLWLSHLASDLLAVRLFLYQDMTDLQ